MLFEVALFFFISLSFFLTKLKLKHDHFPFRSPLSDTYLFKEFFFLLNLHKNWIFFSTWYLDRFSFFSHFVVVFTLWDSFPSLPSPEIFRLFIFYEFLFTTSRLFLTTLTLKIFSNPHTHTRTRVFVNESLKKKLKKT